MSEYQPTARQLRAQAANHRELALRNPQQAATHNYISEILETEAEAMESGARLQRVKTRIAEHEASGRHTDARRARELLAEATEAQNLVRMGRERRRRSGKEF